MKQKEYQTVVLGALLHDIGKLLQKGDFGPSGIKIEGKHPEVSENFIKAFENYFGECSDVSLLRVLVKRHHENTQQYPEALLVQNAEKGIRPLAYIVSRADNYSSSERGLTSEISKGYKTTPLACIFGRLKISGENPDGHYHYRLAPLDPDCAFPENFRINTPDEVNAHLRNFGDDFDKTIKELNCRSFPCFFTHLLALLEK
ncbi:MAG: HD domain-containing protein, partial [Candidatus Brocadiales bacterium]